MIEKFNGIIYLIIFIIHFAGLGAYSYQMIIGNKKFREKFEMHETASTIMRMVGAIFLGSPSCTPPARHGVAEDLGLAGEPDTLLECPGRRTGHAISVSRPRVRRRG